MLILQIYKSDLRIKGRVRISVLHAMCVSSPWERLSVAVIVVYSSVREV